MDNLKKYLQQHVNDLDTDTPGNEVWQRLRKETMPVIPKRSVIQRVVRYAAAACVLLCIAAGAFIIGKRRAPATVAIHTSNDTGKPSETIALLPNADSVKKSYPTDVVKLMPERKAGPAQVYIKKEPVNKKPVITRKKILMDPAQLMVQDIEQNYGQLVHMQLQQLRVMPVYAESPDYFSIFKQQFKQIETDEAIIKKHIRQHGLTEELLQQLININQQKLSVLKDLRAEISKLNNKVKQPQNRQDSSQSFYLNM